MTSTRGRARIALRVVLAIAGSYAAASGFVAIFSVAAPALGMVRSEAVVLGALLGFLVCLGLAIRGFAGTKGGFRRSMAWLHNWAGVVLGGLMFAIFWMGTLAVFDREIDRWMAPMTRAPLPDRVVSLDSLRWSWQAACGAPFWSVAPASERRPVHRAIYRDGGRVVTHTVDPATGARLPDPGTLAGSGFLYPFHVHLHLQAAQIGNWIVGLAGMAMLALLLSGVVIHRKIFADFFSLRLRHRRRRAVLDLHNVAGVIGLPFHIVIAFSGLALFFAIYFPSGWQAGYGTRQAFNADAYGLYGRPKAHQPGTLASLDAMVAEARALWAGDAPRSLFVYHPGDAASYVGVYRGFDREVLARNDAVYFDAASGAVLHVAGAGRPVMTAQRFLSGLHLIQFRHWTLRGVYFVLGLTGCVMIATGYIFWLESRRRAHAPENGAGFRIVEALTVGSVTGIVVATLAFFVANRVLPLGISFLGQDRAALEIWAFYLAWLACFGHAWRRARQAWGGQCRAIAALAFLAVALNAATTGDHLGRSLSQGLWAVAGMDLVLIATALAAATAAWSLRRQGCAAPALSARDQHA